MNKGFTLVEILVVMMFLTVFTAVFSVVMIPYDPEYIHPETCQLQAMATKETCVWEKGVHFNAHGNINQARTLKYHAKTCVFQLGMGRYACE